MKRKPKNRLQFGNSPTERRIQDFDMFFRARAQRVQIWQHEHAYPIEKDIDYLIEIRLYIPSEEWLDSLPDLVIEQKSKEMGLPKKPQRQSAKIYNFARERRKRTKKKIGSVPR